MVEARTSSSSRMTHGCWRIAPFCSKAVDVDDSLGKGLRSFLRQVVSNASITDTVRIFSRDFLRINATVNVRNGVGVAFKGNRGHRDGRTDSSEPPGGLGNGRTPTTAHSAA